VKAVFHAEADVFHPAALPFTAAGQRHHLHLLNNQHLRSDAERFQLHLGRQRQLDRHLGDTDGRQDGWRRRDAETGN